MSFIVGQQQQQTSGGQLVKFQNNHRQRISINSTPWKDSPDITTQKKEKKKGRKRKIVYPYLEEVAKTIDDQYWINILNEAARNKLDGVC